jgi:uncharacterized repeat protein (TIGR01451 family)
MKTSSTFWKIWFTVSCIISLLVPNLVFWANPAVVNLLTTDNFAVLAGSAITGSGTITGDLGLSPWSAVTGFPPGIIIGTQHIADATAVLAQTHLTSAYNISSSQTPVSTVATELGGTTKIAGIYDSSAGTFWITGTLTLDALGDPSAVFIFRTASTLITAWASNIALINGAQACNVFWIVGSSATLGTNSIFKGNILAVTSITATTGVTIEWRLLARNGAVTIDNNSITRAVCLIPPTATLRIIKVVNNSGGWIALPSSFNLHVKNSNVDVLWSPNTGTGSPGIVYTLNSGTYTISEDTNATYASSFSGDCSSTGSLTLSGSESKTCTITNTYIPPTIPPIIIPPVTGPGGWGGNYIVPLITTPITTTIGILSPTIKPTISSGVILRPYIRITKTPSQLTPFPFGWGNVTYNYIVRNPGKVPLHNITLTDDKCSPIVYVSSGDSNSNKHLDPTEVWKYKCRTNITITTKNTVVVTARGNGYTATAKATANLFVATPTFPKTGLYQKKEALRSWLPIYLKIPKIHVNAKIEHVGVTPKWAMDVPKDPNNSAWYNLGPRPWEVGSAVIVGHYWSWNNGTMSVFENLGKLKIWDILTTEDDSWIVTSFIARAIRHYDPAQSTTEVFVSNDNKSHLNIITCEWTWNIWTQSYSKRLVIFMDKIWE